jgi:hypothetical protein
MRKIFKIIKENFCVIILLLGVGLFINGLFSFDSDSYSIYGVNKKPFREIPSSIDTYPVAISTYYSYDYSARGNLTIGAILIVFGLVKIRKKKDEN